MLGKSLGRIFADGASAVEPGNGSDAHGKGGGEEGWRVRKDGSRFWWY
jgi:hypothetical protein